MQKAVFRVDEINQATGKLILKPTMLFQPKEEPSDAAAEYTGPTVEQMREEADAFRMEWEMKKGQMIADAEAEVDALRRQSREAAEQELQISRDAIEAQRSQAAKDAESVVTEAKEKAERLVADGESRKEEITKTARDEGLLDGKKKGYAEGYAEGKAEADRLIERLHGMMDAIFQKRDDILMETENQIVALTLMMTEKVVKTMAESDAAVVRENIIAALEKIRTKSEVILRVNTLDLKLATEHADDFVKAVENVTGVKVVEDTTVGQGGCIVETDFGAIDARISSQLMELEQKIRELSPVRARRK